MFANPEMFADARHLRVVSDSNGTARVVYHNKTVSRIVASIAVCGIVLIGLSPQDRAVSAIVAERESYIAQKQSQERVAAKAAETKKIEAAILEGRRQQATLDYLVKKFPSVSKYAFERILEYTREASVTYSVPQSMILSLIETESRFNPFAKSTGNAEGLMQVIPFWHKEKMEAIGGVHNIVDPKLNILTGTRVFKEYLDRAGQNQNRALQMYLGDPNSEAANVTYANKVLAVKKELDAHLSKLTLVTNTKDGADVLQVPNAAGNAASRKM